MMPRYYLWISVNLSSMSLCIQKNHQALWVPTTIILTNTIIFTAVTTITNKNSSR